MTKYLFKRLLHGLVSVVIVVGCVMTMIYSLMDRNLIFAQDATYSHQSNNQKKVYKYQKWETYGYLDYVTYADYLNALKAKGEIDEDTRSKAVAFGRTKDQDSELVSEYVKKFTAYYKAKGYTVRRYDAIMMGKKKYANGGQQQLFAYRDIPLATRLGKYFSGLIDIDSIHDAAKVEGKRGITFTLHDPVYGGKKFSPAIMGNGTTHKYLMYFDSKFPYFHQNIITINLGKSYSVNEGVDVALTMTRAQGSYVKSEITYPSGLVEYSADDLHSATYMSESQDASAVHSDRFTDDYTNVDTVKSGKSKIGYSFVIGIIAGLVIVFAVEFFDQIARIDDPVGAISVHGVCGALGTLLVGVFAVDGGLLYGGGSELLIIQATGVAAVAAYIGIVMTLIFQILDKTIGLRVSTREEIAGLDMEEHGLASSYADFMPAAEDFHGAVTAQEAAEAGAAVTHVTAALPAAGRPKMTKIVIITSQLRFEILKEALDKLGITGMTVTKVLGYGLQKGNTEYYRGAEVSVHLLPKVKVELVVSAIPVAAVVAAAKKVLYTGKYGDGKIFIYDVENVVKIRTGEEGYEALQDEPIEA